MESAGDVIVELVSEEANVRLLEHAEVSTGHVDCLDTLGRARAPAEQGILEPLGERLVRGQAARGLEENELSVVRTFGPVLLLGVKANRLHRQSLSDLWQPQAPIREKAQQPDPDGVSHAAEPLAGQKRGQVRDLAQATGGDGERARRESHRLAGREGRREAAHAFACESPWFRGRRDIRCVKQRHHPDGLSLFLKLAGDFERDHAADTQPAEKIRAVGLDGPNYVEVIRRHVGSAGVYDRGIRSAAGQQSINRPVLVDPTRQVQI
jgi:hypothetical protein